MADDLQQHLDHGRYGSLQVNPDEQRQYLGTFRERCYLSMTIAQMQETTNQTLFKQHLTDFPDGHILLNGQLNDTLQNKYLTFITQANIPFTIVTNQHASDIGLLIVADTAVDEAIIDIAQKYPTQQKEEPTTPKRSFWQKLFKA